MAHVMSVAETDTEEGSQVKPVSTLLLHLEPGRHVIFSVSGESCHCTTPWLSSLSIKWDQSYLGTIVCYSNVVSQKASLNERFLIGNISDQILKDYCTDCKCQHRQLVNMCIQNLQNS